MAYICKFNKLPFYNTPRNKLSPAYQVRRKSQTQHRNFLYGYNDLFYCTYTVYATTSKDFFVLTSGNACS